MGMAPAKYRCAPSGQTIATGRGLYDCHHFCPAKSLSLVQPPAIPAFDLGQAELEHSTVKAGLDPAWVQQTGGICSSLELASVGMRNNSW